VSLVSRPRRHGRGVRQGAPRVRSNFDTRPLVAPPYLDRKFRGSPGVLRALVQAANPRSREQGRGGSSTDTGRSALTAGTSRQTGPRHDQEDGELSGTGRSAIAAAIRLMRLGLAGLRSGAFLCRQCLSRGACPHPGQRLEVVSRFKFFTAMHFLMELSLGC
jgi:hypothetical protein